MNPLFTTVLFDPPAGVYPTSRDGKRQTSPWTILIIVFVSLSIGPLCDYISRRVSPGPSNPQPTSGVRP